MAYYKNRNGIGPTDSILIPTDSDFEPPILSRAG